MFFFVLYTFIITIKDSFALSKHLKNYKRIFFSSQVAKIINQLDGDGNLPLGLALAEKQTAIANVLCEHKADVNAKDQYGWSLLQRAIQRGN